MCGGSAPQDNSAQVAQIEAQAAREAREAQAVKEAQQRTEFDSRLNSAFGTGIDDATSYFQSQGLDPNEYLGSITKKANSVKGSVPLLDQAPGTYFQALGQQVYDQEQEGYRGKNLRALDTVAPTGFSTKRIDNTVDDTLIESLLAEQLSSGDDYIRNLLDRGVITTSGYNAAQKNLQGQSAGARSRLNETGLGLVEGGRGGAENIANAGRSTASNLRLGQQFDPYDIGTQLNDYFTDFFTNLGSKFRASAPANLFDTSGLAGIAGAAQGAGNTAFNPSAITGILGQDQQQEEDDPFASSNPF
jgi:hypothetical protein